MGEPHRQYGHAPDLDSPFHFAIGLIHKSLQVGVTLRTFVRDTDGGA